jgi:PAS domain S-box-containing protein
MDEVRTAWLELQARVEELARERQQYVVFFECAADAYLITDAHGTIQDANGAAVDIFRRRKSYLRGKPLAALIALDQRPSFRTRLRALGGGETAAEWDSIVEAPGERLPVRLSARLMGCGIGWRLRTQP